MEALSGRDRRKEICGGGEIRHDDIKEKLPYRMSTVLLGGGSWNHFQQEQDMRDVDGKESRALKS